MNRVRFLIACLILLLSLSVASAALAAPPAQTATPGPPVGLPPYWYGEYTVRSTVPFVWIRRNPSSSSDVLDTVGRGDRVRGIPLEGSEGNMVWDGAQWWAYVSGPRVKGWVEVASLTQITPGATATPVTANGAQPWKANNVLRVRRDVSFAWFRSGPFSNALNVGEVRPGTQLVVLTGTPQYDGTQWWWQVRDSGGYNAGYMEQNLLEFVRVRPNFVVSPILPGFWREGYIVRVKANLPFVWVRQTPGSSAMIVETVLRRTELRLGTGVHEDAVQVWREVSFGSVTG